MLKEIKEGHIQMMRTKRRLQKVPNQPAKHVEISIEVPSSDDNQFLSELGIKDPFAPKVKKEKAI